MLLSHTQLKLRVSYNAPAFNCRRVLRILPAHSHNQRVLKELLQIQPIPDIQQESPDKFGNRRLLLVHRHIPMHLDIQLDVEVESNPDLEYSETPPDPSFLIPSKYANLNHDIRRFARGQTGLARETELALGLCEFVSRHLTYEPEPRPTPYTSTQILELRRGSCQDFAHFMISLCRAANLPARYVAGYNPAEGDMHAWVEVWADRRWQTFDPTHGRPVTPGSIVVAVGRDFQDTQTILGQSRGGTAHPQIFCRTRVEEL